MQQTIDERCRQVFHYRIALSSEKSLPSRQFTGKNPLRRAAARRGGFLPANCQPGETLLGAIQ